MGGGGRWAILPPMHISAMTAMDDCLAKYLSKDKKYRVLDFGSFVNRGQTLNHRLLLRRYRCTVVGVDIQAGNNVDRQMTKPYRIPVRSRSQDVVLSGQVFEHIPFPFASVLEIARVLKRGGYFFMTVPSRGHRHSTYDLWRFYPDSMRAFALFADLELVEAHTDFPPRVPESRRHDYGRIDSEYHYWGDTTAVFRKPAWKPSLWRLVNRAVTLHNANRIGDLSGAPLPPVPVEARRAARRRRQRRMRARVKKLQGTGPLPDPAPDAS
jgi:SAM-dependent methyltransferase